MNKKQLEKKTLEYKIEVMKMLQNAGSGHAAGALSAAEMFTYLHHEFLNITPENFNEKDRNYFLLSNGHICAIWYAVLADLGFLEKDELMSHRKFGSRLQGHPWNLKTPGVFNSSGMLGHGPGQSVGVALGLKMDNINDKKVVCFMSDGEQEEGAVWEAAMSAAKYELDNLIWVIDRNKIQIEGTTEEIMPLDDKDTIEDDLVVKYKGFDFDVRVINGHDFDDIERAVKAEKIDRKPRVIISHTVASRGIPEMEGSPEYHDWRENKELSEKAVNILEEKLKNYE